MSNEIVNTEAIEKLDRNFVPVEHGFISSDEIKQLADFGYDIEIYDKSYSNNTNNCYIYRDCCVFNRTSLL